jgi:hypothetical protein
LGTRGPARQRQSHSPGQGALEAVKLIKTGEIVSLGMPRDAQMPIAPGRAYALRMPGDKTNMLFYNGNRLSEMWSPYGLKKLGIENARPFFTRGVLFGVRGLKGRVLDVGEEIALADLKACLERQGVDERTIATGDAVFVRTGRGRRYAGSISGSMLIGLKRARRLRF